MAPVATDAPAVWPLPVVTSALSPVRTTFPTTIRPPHVVTLALSTTTPFAVNPPAAVRGDPAGCSAVGQPAQCPGTDCLEGAANRDLAQRGRSDGCQHNGAAR